MSATNDPSATPVSRTVAWFGSSEELRAAALRLEQNGVDSMYVDIARPPVDPATRTTDERTMGWFAQNAAIGLVVGALIGAALGVLIGVLLGAEGTILLVAAFAGAVFGLAPGAFYMVGTRLPVNEQAFDTYGEEPGGPDWISVGGPAEIQETAERVLTDLTPVRIEVQRAA